MGHPYGLAQFVDDLRKITADTRDPRVIVERVRPLARELALSRAWLEAKHYTCDPDQGFGVHLLHEEPDHTLAVFAGAWLPGRGAPPHNHGTWAVVTGVDGDETNAFWTRQDDGSRAGHAEIRRRGERVFGPGDVVAFQPDSIHSVVNATDRVTISLHVYGKHVNYTTRSQFDPAQNTERAFKVTVAECPESDVRAAHDPDVTGPREVSGVAGVLRPRRSGAR
jgi:predicted metal-dependent enzyme (double-stranded beta helix superfamily)